MRFELKARQNVVHTLGERGAWLGSGTFIFVGKSTIVVFIRVYTMQSSIFETPSIQLKRAELYTGIRIVPFGATARSYYS